MACCKTTEVQDIFKDLASIITWPSVTSICGVCRPNLPKVRRLFLQKSFKALD